MIHYKLLSDLHRDSGWPPPANPLFSVGRCTEVCTIGNRAFTSDFHMIWFKKLKAGVVLHGRTRYDHDNGCMGFVAPRQVIEFSNLEFEEDGFMIVVHEDYLNGHPLHSAIKKFGYFDYDTNEALHLSTREQQVMWELYEQIRTEYDGNPDEYSREIILTHLDSLLRYCQRYYKRQFIDRTVLSDRTASRFNEALTAWRRVSGDPENLPTVQAIARDLHLSPRYLSDLLKQETGKTAMELIHIFLIGEAKDLLKSADHTVTETAYKLGFENLPYFSRLFKKEVGVSPMQFKKQMN